MTHEEYRANMDGLNIFFGATLGFVISDADRLSNLSFAWLLLMAGGLVISILYISASRKRITYLLLTGLMILFLPSILDTVFRPGEFMPGKLQPALAIWTLMVALVEFLPRDAPAAPAPPAS